MIEALKSWVSNIIAIIFFITLIEILIPNGSVKKYIGFVSGILIIITIMSPVVRALGNKIEFEIPDIQNSDSTMKSQIDQKSQQLTQMQSRQVISVYKEKLSNGIKNILSDMKNFSCKNAECIVYEDQNDRLGEIKQVTVTMADREKTDKDTRIKPIQINININKESNNINTQQIPDDVRKEIIRRITSNYNVREEQIKINYISEKR